MSFTLSSYPDTHFRFLIFVAFRARQLFASPVNLPSYQGFSDTIPSLTGAFAFRFSLPLLAAPRCSALLLAVCVCSCWFLFTRATAVDVNSKPAAEVPLCSVSGARLRPPHEPQRLSTCNTDFRRSVPLSRNHQTTDPVCVVQS